MGITKKMTETPTKRGRKTKKEKFFTELENCSAGLNSKQIEFARMYVETGKKSDSWRIVYNGHDSSRQVAARRSSELLENPLVRRYISVLRRHADEETIQATSLTDQFVIEALLDTLQKCTGRRGVTMTDADGTITERRYFRPTEAVRILELLGKVKIVDLFAAEKSEVKMTGKFNDMTDEELAAYEEKLREQATKSGVESAN